MGTVRNHRRQLIWEILADATPDCAMCPYRKLVPFPSDEHANQSKKTRGTNRLSHALVTACYIAASVALAVLPSGDAVTKKDIARTGPVVLMSSPGAFDHPLTKYLAGCDPMIQCCVPDENIVPFDVKSQI